MFAEVSTERFGECENNAIRSKTMNKLFARLLKSESGATAIEYGLIASLIGIAIIAATKALGTKLSSSFSNVTGNLS